MRTREQIAADLASAAADRVGYDLDNEPSKQAKTAKTTARDQLLEAAYSLAHNNVPTLTSTGWLIKSKSTTAGTLVHLRAGCYTIQRLGKNYVVNGGEILEPGSLECELEVAQGKTYKVDLDISRCTCAGGSIPGKVCWHMCAVEFWVEAGSCTRQRKKSNSASRDRVRHTSGCEWIQVWR